MSEISLLLTTLGAILLSYAGGVSRTRGLVVAVLFVFPLAAVVLAFSLWGYRDLSGGDFCYIGVTLALAAGLQWTFRRLDFRKRVIAAYWSTLGFMITYLFWTSVSRYMKANGTFPSGVSYVRGLLFFLLMSCIGSFSLPLVIQGMEWMGGAVVLRRLRRKGYADLTTSQAVEFFRILGIETSDVPPYDQMGVIPGHEEEVMKLVIELVKRRRAAEIGGRCSLG